MAFYERLTLTKLVDEKGLRDKIETRANIHSENLTRRIVPLAIIGCTLLGLCALGWSSKLFLAPSDYPYYAKKRNSEFFQIKKIHLLRGFQGH